MGTRLWYAMWDANEDDDAAFQRRANPLLREIGDRCKVVAVETGQQPHEPTQVPSPAPTRQVAQAQTPGAGAPHGSTSSSQSNQQREKTAQEGPPAVATMQAQPEAPAMGAHGNTRSSLRTQERENEASQVPAMTSVHRMPSTASSMSSGNFAEMAAFFREERAQFEEKLEVQRQQYEACAWDAKLKGLQERFDALHQAKLLTNDEMIAFEDKIADFMMIVSMCDRVSKDEMLARQLRKRYL